MARADLMHSRPAYGRPAGRTEVVVDRGSAGSGQADGQGAGDGLGAASTATGGRRSRRSAPPADARRVLRGPVVVTALGAAGLVLYLWPDVAAAIVNRLFSTEPVVMPPGVTWTLFGFYVLFIVGSVFPFFLFLGWTALAYTRLVRAGVAPFVSVIVPAFNEERCISRSLQAAARLDYPAYEVIVVDDGSTDMTPFLAEGAPVSFVRLERNGGKARALNAGVARAKGEIIVFSDSDSSLHPSALRYLVGHFADPTVGAVAGTVEVDRPSTLLTCWQQLEYIFGHAVLKAAQIGSGSSVTVCPGPISAFRRAALVAAGGVKARTLTEDFDLTLSVVQRGFRVVHEPRAIAYTEVPRSWRELKYQRLRWSRGSLQVLRLHRNLLFRSRTGALGLFWLPYLLVFGYGGALLEVVAIVAFPLLAWASGRPMQLLQFAAVYALMLESFNFGQYAVALILAGRGRSSSVLFALIIQPYRFWLNAIRLLAVSREVRRAAVTWSG